MNNSYYSVDFFIAVTTVIIILIGVIGIAGAILNRCDFACKLDLVEKHTEQYNALEQYAPDECRSMAMAEVFGNGMEEGN